MGKGIVGVSFDLLVQALRFPEGTEILGVREVDAFSYAHGPTAFELKVSHPDLPVAEERGRIPTYLPQFRNVPVLELHYETQFVSWDDKEVTNGTSGSSRQRNKVVSPV